MKNKKRPKDGSFVVLPFNNEFAWAVHHKYDPKMISLPGGGVEENQDFESAAIAEVAQETSFNIENVKKLAIFHGRKSKTETALFLGQVPNFKNLKNNYDENEISHQVIIPIEAPLHIPMFRASRLFLKVYSLYLDNLLETPIEEFLSPPFKNPLLQEWAEKTKLYL